MPKSYLPKASRELIKQVILHRAEKFPRADLLSKLTVSDKCYHLANVRADDNANNQADSYSRFQELDNALVREVAEAYETFYSQVFLGANKIFTMTSTADGQDVAAQFNAILANQARRMNWGRNLQKLLQDISKYNIGATEVVWEQVEAYSPDIQLASTGAVASRSKSTVAWAGNAIKHLDMYNTLFDTRVPLSELPERGEWAGYISYLSQVELYKLVKRLEANSDVVTYIKDPDNPDFDIYRNPPANLATGHNLDYRVPRVTPLGGVSVPRGDQGDWLSFFGGNATPTGTYDDYTVTVVYLRLVPSSYKLTGDTVQLWKIWLLDGSWILASQLVEAAHNLLPIVFGQSDEDSLGINTACPAQIAIPYQKTAKQLMDRVLAGADRAIRDRAIYDSRYLDGNALSSAIPDAKIPLKSPLPPNKSISAVYQSTAMGSDTTGLKQDSLSAHDLGLRACGVNNSLVGQFTKGNRTLEEYSDVQTNAQSRQIKRAASIEASYMTALKRILKLNILEHQGDETIFDSQSKQAIEVVASNLFKAEVEFALADGLKPTEHMMSPNVQQQLFTLIQARPEAFSKYDIGKLIAHIVTQSYGVDMQQYEYSAEELAQIQQQQAALLLQQQQGKQQ